MCQVLPNKVIFQKIIIQKNIFLLKVLYMLFSVIDPKFGWSSSLTRFHYAAVSRAGTWFYLEQGKSSQLMPPGMQHHIWPGAMQRRLVVEALWLAFYPHIWLHKISVLGRTPGKYTSRVTTKKQHASEMLSGAVCVWGGK